MFRSLDFFTTNGQFFLPDMSDCSALLRAVIHPGLKITCITYLTTTQSSMLFLFPCRFLTLFSYSIRLFQNRITCETYLLLISHKTGHKFFSSVHFKGLSRERNRHYFCFWAFSHLGQHQQLLFLSSAVAGFDKQIWVPSLSCPHPLCKHPRVWPSSYLITEWKCMPIEPALVF